MKKQLLLLAFLLCRQMTLFSQYTVSGVVKDENGSALSGASIVVEGSNYRVNSNLKGEFMLKSLQPGNYQLVVSFLGYETIKKGIELNQNVQVEITMAIKDFLTDEVIITATRAQNNMPVTQSTVGKEEIRSQNLGRDIPYLLALEPSVVTSSDAGAGIGYTNYRIRGTDLKRTNVTVNGVPLNDAESHGVFWVNMPDFASSVENIQVQRGVGTSTQGGGAFGATINLQTLNINKKAYAEINNSYGSFNTFKNNVMFGTGLINGHFTFDARLSKLSTDGYIERAWSDLKSFYVSGAYYSAKTLVKLNVFSGKEVTYQAWDGVPSDILKVNRRYNGIGYYTDDSGQGRYYDNETDNYQQDHFQLHISHALSSNFNVNVSAHYTIGKGYYEQYKENAKFRDYQLSNLIIGNDTIKRTNLIRRKWLDNDFYGAIWSLNYTQKQFGFVFGGGWNQYYGEHFGKVRWAKFMSNGQLDHEYYYSSGVKNDFNFFTKATFNLSDKFNFFADAQFRTISQSFKGIDDKLKDDGSLRDITQKHKFSFFNPKAGVGYNISDEQNVYGYVGIAHREPNRDDFVDADPSQPLPKPERLIDYELGYKFNSKLVQLGLNFYYMDYKDQLVLTGKINDVGAPVMINVKDSYRAGVEITASVGVFKNLLWAGNATFSRNIVKNFNEYVDLYDEYWDPAGQDIFEYSQKPLSFSPQIVAGSQFLYKLNPVTIALISKYVGKQYIDNTGNDLHKLNPYLVNDIRLNTSFNIKSIGVIEAIACVYNVLDEKYEANAWVYHYIQEGNRMFSDGYYPQAGRNYMVSLVLKF